MAAVEECVAGERTITPAVSLRYGYAKTALAARLMERATGWCVVIDPVMRLGDDRCVPDLAGWLHESRPAADALAIDSPPRWICEMVSPITAALDRVRKLPRYARAGVNYAWCIDPLERSLEVFRIHGSVYQLLSVHDDTEPIRAEPFEACELNLASLWLD